MRYYQWVSWKRCLETIILYFYFSCHQYSLQCSGNTPSLSRVQRPCHQKKTQEHHLGRREVSSGVEWQEQHAGYRNKVSRASHLEALQKQTNIGTTHNSTDTICWQFNGNRNRNLNYNWEPEITSLYDDLIQRAQVLVTYFQEALI